MFKRRSQRIMTSLPLCLMIAAQASAGDLPSADLSTGTAVLRGGGDGFQVGEKDAVAAGIATHTLSSARTLYRDLLAARRAARSHNTLDTRLAIGEATRLLDNLYNPTQVSSLMRESAVIREDLRDTSHAPDPHLWLPLEADLTRIRVQIPTDRMHQASAAIHTGARAASRGDRQAVGTALDMLETALGYRFALMPIRRIRGDLESAQAAMYTAPPRWRGVSEAIDSALASVRWVTDIHAHGWLSAYQHAADALAELGHHPHRARQALARIPGDLYAWPQGTSVSSRARHLAANPSLTESQVYELLDQIRILIPGTTPA